MITKYNCQVVSFYNGKYSVSKFVKELLSESEGLGMLNRYSKTESEFSRLFKSSAEFL